MRKKGITAFVSVYIALCVAYGVTNRITALPDIEATNTFGTEILQVATEIDTSVTEEEKNTDTTTPSMEFYTETVTVCNLPTEIPQKSEEQIFSGEFYTEVQTEPETEPEVQIEPETEPAQDIPSLEEFLKNLRCSGCRHNCSLFSPRCMNGARKASQAQSEYHEMYG